MTAAGLLWLACTHGATAAIETEDCRLSAAWLATVSARCGILSVPENPSDPEGRHIELFVARISSLTGVAEPDPLLLISGGPGQASSELYLTLRRSFELVRRDREIILVDQRGTGRSARLSCPAADAEDLETSGADELRRLVAECLETLEGDPRYYTTSVAVEDLELVREALEVPVWNIYGISYGTRVAQHYLRRFPQSTRSVILDGVAPPEIAFGPQIAANAQATLDAILSRCTEDADCVERFPALEDNFDALRARLAERPLDVALTDPVSGAPVTRTLSERHLQVAIRLMSYAPQMAALLPLLLSEAYDGYYAPLTAQAYMVIGDLERSISFPMHNAVVCTEDVPFFDDSVPTDAAAYLGRSVADALEAVCSVWPGGIIDPDLKAPLSSDRPALLLSGEHDPVTPPDYGDRVLESLANARHLVVSGQGHGMAVVGCIPHLMRRFLNDLDPEGLDASCLLRARPTPFFLDFSGPAP